MFLSIGHLATVLDDGMAKRADRPGSGRRTDRPSSGRRTDRPESGRRSDRPSSGRRNDTPSHGRRSRQGMGPMTPGLCCQFIRGHNIFNVKKMEKWKRQNKNSIEPTEGCACLEGLCLEKRKRKFWDN